MARIDCQRWASKSASRRIAKAAAKATPEPTDMGAAESPDMAARKPADIAPFKPADVAPPKPAAVAPAAHSAPCRGDVRRRSGQGSRNGKNCGYVQYRTQRASSRHRRIRWRSRSNWRTAERGRSDWGLESADPKRRFGLLRASALTQLRQPPREPQQLRVDDVQGAAP